MHSAANRANAIFAFATFVCFGLVLLNMASTYFLKVDPQVSLKINRVEKMWVELIWFRALDLHSDRTNLLTISFLWIGGNIIPRGMIKQCFLLTLKQVEIDILYNVFRIHRFPSHSIVIYWLAVGNAILILILLSRFPSSLFRSLVCVSLEYEDVVCLYKRPISHPFQCKEDEWIYLPLPLPLLYLLFSFFCPFFSFPLFVGIRIRIRIDNP